MVAATAVPKYTPDDVDGCRCGIDRRMPSRKSELESSFRDRRRLDLDGSLAGAGASSLRIMLPPCAERHAEAIGRGPVRRLVSGVIAPQPSLAGHVRMLCLPPGAEATAAGI